MANMIKFFKGLEASLPTSGVNGALYITTDEGAIYLGTGTGMKRLGDFVQVANVASLPAKAHESCLYYCVAENILAKWNGTEWKQINKQPTAEELKGLLGLGSMAYKSEVAEDNLSSALKEKVNAAAEGNHSHSNKTVLDGITSDKVTAWDGAEAAAKTYADGLNTAMNTRVEALEAIDHEHANKALLDTYTQTEANLADAVAKKHEHANATELDKIAAGDVAKWNGVVADHLVAADKTELADSIGDVSTALENYKTSNNDALAGVKATAEAAATKEYTDAELAKKVTKTDYEADKATFATKTDIAKLAGVSEGANKVEASETNGNIKIDGVETVVYTHPDKHAIGDVTGLQDALDAKVAQSAYDADKATFATKTELGNVDKKFESYTTTTAQQAIDAEQDRRLGVIEGDYVKSADIADFETKGNVAKVAEDLAAETKARTEADTGFETRIAALEGNFGDGEGTVEAQIAAAVKVEEDARKEAVAGVQGEVDAVEGRMDTAEGKISTLETESAKHAIKTEVEGALALKADKSVVDAMYTNDQIDGFIAEAKKYADDNDADTKYGIVYDSDNKKIKLVEGGTDVEIDASAFIKDGMINTVTIDENDDLIITFNTDAGKENIVLPLDQLVDIYTGFEGDRIKVTVNADKSISADLIAGSISKDYLDDGVKASLALADSALQSHQDISHLAVKTQVATDIENAVKAETERATGVENGLDGRIKDLEDNKAGYATTGEVATAKGEAITEAGKLDATLKSELQAEIDADVKVVSDALAQYKIDNDAAVALKANTADVYAKTETFTKDEVNAAIAAAIETAHTWGEF